MKGKLTRRQLVAGMTASGASLVLGGPALAQRRNRSNWWWGYTEQESEQPADPEPEPEPEPDSSVDSTVVYLSDLQWTSVANGWGPVEPDTSNGEQNGGDGNPMALNGQVYEKGLGVHAYSEVHVHLGGSYGRFISDIGIDDEVGDNGSVSFELHGDGNLLFQSGRLTGSSAAETVDVNIDGVHDLVLIVRDGGDNPNFDHANWAGARVLYSTDSESPSQPIDPEEPAEPDPPDEDAQTPGVALTPSGAVSVSQHGQVIEGLDISATGSTSAVQIGGYQDVTIRNCRIRHEYRSGIDAWGNFSGLVIEDCEIECVGAPATGANRNADMENIRLWGDGRDPSNVVIRRVRLSRGSSGVYARYCHGIVIEELEGHDFRGPFPRGQVVQFHHCNDPILQDFSVIGSGNVTWSEDNVNCYGSTDPVIRRGFIQGNNSPSGVGVLIENNSGGRGGLVEDVDCVFWGNGGFSAADNSSNVTFRRCRARDGVSLEQHSGNVGSAAYDGSSTPSWETFVGGLGRSGPMSGSEGFMTWQNGNGIRFEQCQYCNLPRGGWWFHNSGGVNHSDIREQEFTPRSPIVLHFGWD